MGSAVDGFCPRKPLEVRRAEDVRSASHSRISLMLAPSSGPTPFSTPAKMGSLRPGASRLLKGLILTPASHQGHGQGRIILGRNLCGFRRRTDGMARLLRN